MEVALVDACGGRYGDVHGSIQIYDVKAEEWEARDGYSLPPDETIAVMKELESEGKASLKQTINPDDVVTV